VRLRAADLLYTEYSMEEVIYQLAKVMFSQSLMRGEHKTQNTVSKLRWGRVLMACVVTKKTQKWSSKTSFYLFFPLSSKFLPSLRFVLPVSSLLPLKYFKLSFCSYLSIVPVFPPYFFHMRSLLSLVLSFKAFLSFYFMSVPSFLFLPLFFFSTFFPLPS